MGKKKNLALLHWIALLFWLLLSGVPFLSPIPLSYSTWFQKGLQSLHQYPLGRGSKGRAHFPASSSLFGCCVWFHCCLCTVSPVTPGSGSLSHSLTLVVSNDSSSHLLTSDLTNPSTYNFSFNSHNNSFWQVQVFPPFYRWEEWSTERLSMLPTVGVKVPKPGFECKWPTPKFAL